MMTAQQLKNSILQRAIEGKLVEQRPEEGTAKELLKQIKLEKEKLVKEGKIKKSKPLPAITEDEIPFEIPDSWEWVRLCDVCWSIVDCPHSTPKYIQNKTDYVAIDTNCIDDNGNITRWRYVNIDDYENRVKRLIPQKGDIVLTREGSIGRAAILPEGVNVCLGQRVMLLRPANMAVKYMRWFLMSPDTLMRLTVQQKGLGAKHINVSDICKIEVPIPPLSEQHRIVAKIEELMPLVDQYDKAYSQIKALNEKFPQDMKKSILQYAIEGKLVEQRSEEGTAADLLKEIKAEKAKLIKEGKIKKSKLLPPITEDEIPFEIPDSWEWVRLSDIIDVRDGTHDTPKYYPSGIPLITSKNISTGRLIFDDVKYISEEDAKAINMRSNVEDGDILFAMIGSIGNPIIVHKTREFCIKNVALFKPYSPKVTFMPYWYWFFNFVQHTMKKEASGGVQSFISLKTFRQFTVPLPPLSEQHRIVEKVGQLLSLCDRLAI